MDYLKIMNLSLHFKFKFLTLLKEIVHHKLVYKVWIEGVLNHLSSGKLLTKQEIL